ncbi:MAG: TatD family hydrolase [Brevinema sp.]
MFIDTHAHLDMTFFSEDSNLDKEKIEELSLDLLELVIHISLDFEEFKKHFPLLKNHPKIAFVTGIYPDRVSDSNYSLDTYIQELKSILITHKHAALGEIGIDLKHESYGSLEEQSSLFRKQLQLASELKLPVVIHSRESFYECYDILKEFPELTMIFHCFSYGKKEADLILEQGNYLSFSGILTYKKSKELQEVAQYVPLDQIFFETDSPYLSPEPLRGKKNYPEYVQHVYRYFAHLRNIPLDDLANHVRNNVHTAFSLD